jgi:hypothetical protein
MEQNGWQPDGKLLASANAVSAWNGGRQRSEDGGSTSCLDDLLRVVSSTEGRELLPLGFSSLTIILSTPVYNYVDSCFCRHLNPEFTTAREMRR